MRKIFSALLLAALITTPVILPSPALSEVRKERVQFKAGTSGTTIQGKIQGEQIVQYLIRANAGQTLSIGFNSDNGGSSFNIYAPGKVPGKDGAMVIGENVSNAYEGSLPATGDYIIQVGLNRNAVRNNEVANYQLKINITGGDLQGDAKVPGTNYHATGNVTCSMGNGQPTGSCPFGVTRRGNGSADVTVTKPDGRKRVIFFENGQAISADTSQADPGDFSASKKDDIYIIRIGKERYEIFEAIVFGG
ncbi:unknown [Crocosphaera subtropica ATCC 51142]|uniref:Peptidase C-terminal archaeal/bacterial domain-containing protein n=1 Tax=Crocosphaera subtropica (strain ATCC 51142 / BH68) TaxID=43989 RepID=B1WZ41_CROS5|nr:hypothetical protein [Crocosphaera subtropica]ACB52805.1 unknown [Crocosphaera subtropica ATCC 51142]